MDQQFVFRDVTDTTFKVRLGLDGSSGAGKTYTSLAVAHALGEKVFVIDTESDSALRYKRYFPNIKHLGLANHHPQSYIAAITAAERAGADVIIVDSLSHAWVGTDGALALVDKAAARGGNSYTAWRDVTPMHNALVTKLITSSAHMICTLRTKTEYVLEENDRGKKVPRKIGMAPVFRDGIEYEFDVMMSLDAQHVATVTKTRCPAIDGERFIKPGAEVGTLLREWTETGEAKKPETGTADPELGGSFASENSPSDAANMPPEKDTKDEVNSSPLPDDGFLAAVNNQAQRIGETAYIALTARLGITDPSTLDLVQRRDFFGKLQAHRSNPAARAEALAAQLTKEAS